MSKNLKKLLALVLALTMVLSLAACGNNATTPTEGTEAPTDAPAESTYTYNTYLMVSPSNWNELTYQDNNDTEIMQFIGSSFFNYDFKFDENGEIVPGEFVMRYDAATKLEDVTAQYAEEWGLPADGKGYAYKITLRDDLKWQNGDPIKAEDFVYTMQEQLNPLFRNYRADSYYVGATVIANAEAYAKQGQSAPASFGSVMSMEGLADMDAFLAAHGEETAYINWNYSFGAAYDAETQEWVAPEDAVVATTMTVKEMVPFFVENAMNKNGADEATANAWVLEELYVNKVYGEVAWEDVGIFVGDNEYEIVLVLEKPLSLLKEDGSLSYQAAYNMSSLPLVHKATYEANKVEPSAGVELWTSKYNSSVETTMSWGPYVLESFQSGTQYTLVRNENWYGYNLPENEGLYQTDRIVVNIVKDWNSAWLMFQAGEVDGISIDVTIADDYKGSERAYFTPSDFVSSLQLQSNVEQLKAREEAGINKSLLGYTDFRQALSLSINRADFTAQCTTSSKAGYGLFNSMHYYDVENGGVYRNTDEARQVLCDIYGVDTTQYASLEEAEAAITGYNLDLARELLTKAYNEALAAGDIKETDIVKLTFGSGAITEAVTRQYNFIAESWKKLAETTPLEGRIELEIKDYSDAWANDFRAGNYDVCMGGWTGAAWDPGYFLLAYLSDGYMYSKAWDTANTMMEFTMKGVGENGEDITENMSLLDWYACLNGTGKYDWSANGLEQSQRLQLIAALEKEVLKVYYTVPLANSFSASMLGYKVDYITYEYNTFMQYGGVRYMTYNFDDAAWAAEVAANNGELNYK